MNTEKFNKYFNGKYENVVISKLTVSDGNMIAADPFGLYVDYPTYIQKLPSGEYDVTACILKNDGDIRISAVNVKISDNIPVRFEMALDGSETQEELDSLEEGEYFGFCVDAGLAAIFDTTSSEAYLKFENSWYSDNPDKNMYDDYFAKMFKESYKLNPDFQRDCGDYIDFIIPGTNYHVPIFASGMGNGLYPVFFGYSEDGSICNMMICFIDT